MSSERITKDILQLWEKIRLAKHSPKREKKIKLLIHGIVSQVRQRSSDILFMTTSIWILLNLIKLDVQSNRDFMIQASVPNIIYDVLKSGHLPEHAKGYASELCRMLCTDDDLTSTKGELAELSVIGLHTSNLSTNSKDDFSEVSYLAKFSPYMIDDRNIELMNEIFEKPLPTNQLHITSASKMWEDLEGSLDSDSLITGSITSAHNFSSTFDWLQQSPQRESHTVKTANRPKSRIEEARRHGHEPRAASSDTSRSDMDAGTYFPEIKGGNSVRIQSPTRRGAPPSPSNGRWQLRRQLNFSRMSASASNLAAEESLARTYAPSLIPDQLAHLDPLSISLSTAFYEASKAELRRAPPNTQANLEAALAEVNSSSAHFSSRLSEKSLKNKSKAENLTDLRFMQRLFTAKATVQDTQNLIYKLQDVLELMDPDQTGHVSWKAFSRVLLSLAPPHLLRSDVMSFLGSQVQNENDLMDYKEFVITGKVLIIENKDAVKELLAKSWFNRQKAGVAPGEDHSSNYTWKKHVEWFRKRKADALIWLMRRANRAIQYDSAVENAKIFLYREGQRSKALTYLLECGLKALRAIDNVKLVKIDLIKRAVHARQWRTKREESGRFLSQVGKNALKFTVDAPKTLIKINPEGTKKYMVTLDSSGNQVVKLVKSQVKTGKAYELLYHQKNAIEFIRERVKLAELYMKTKDVIFEELQLYAINGKRQELVHVEEQRVLVTIGERAVELSATLDAAVLFLMRKGKRVFAHVDRQDRNLQWLRNRGQISANIVERQEKDFAFLSHFGQFHRRRINAREEAIEFLRVRTEIASSLLNRRREAIEFLSDMPRRVWRAEALRDQTQAFLVARGEHAKLHIAKCMKAYTYLKNIAGRSTAANRKRIMAFADLKQIGCFARRLRFEKSWAALAGNKQRLEDEIKRIKSVDKQLLQERKNMPEEERWKAELVDAFVGIALSYSPQSNQNMRNATAFIHRSQSRNNVVMGDDDTMVEIGRLGFKQLIQDGKLLGLPAGTADSAYEGVDSDASGCVSFQEVWTWFVHEARQQKLRKKAVRVLASDIYPAKERALDALMKRFLAEGSDSPVRRSQSVAKEDFDVHEAW